MGIFKNSSEQVKSNIVKLHSDIMAQLAIIELADKDLAAIAEAEEIPGNGVITSLLSKKAEAEIVIKILAKRRLASVKEYHQAQANANGDALQELKGKINNCNLRLQKLDEQRNTIIQERSDLESQHLAQLPSSTPRALDREFYGTEAVIAALADPLVAIADPPAYKKEISRLQEIQQQQKQGFSHRGIESWEHDIEGQNGAGQKTKGRRPIILNRTGMTMPGLKIAIDADGKIIESDLVASHQEYSDIVETRESGEIQDEELV